MPAAGDRRHGDDRPAPLEQVGDRRPSHQERPRDVDSEDALERVRVELEQVAGAADARIEDERVEATEPVDRLGNRASGIRLDARIGDDGKAADLGGHLLDRPGAAAGHRDRIPVGGEPPCRRGADARSAAGDERDRVIPAGP